MSEGISEGLSLLHQRFGAWCPLKGHIYLNMVRNGNIGQKWVKQLKYIVLIS